MLSTYVANNGGRRGSLRSTTCLNEEGLKSLNDIGCDEFIEYMVATGLQVGNGFFESEDGGTGSEVVTEMGNGGVVSSKKVFDVRDLSVGTNKRGERF